jgi:hypothetical protein
VRNVRRFLPLLCTLALTTAEGCGANPSPEPAVKPGPKAAESPAPKSLPQGVKLGPGKAVVQ